MSQSKLPPLYSPICMRYKEIWMSPFAYRSNFLSTCDCSVSLDSIQVILHRQCCIWKCGLWPRWPQGQLSPHSRPLWKPQRKSGFRPFTPSPCGQPKAQQCSSCTVIWERWCTSQRSSRCSDCSSGRSPHIIFWIIAHARARGGVITVWSARYMKCRWLWSSGLFDWWKRQPWMHRAI